MQIRCSEKGGWTSYKTFDGWKRTWKCARVLLGYNWIVKGNSARKLAHNIKVEDEELQDSSWFFLSFNCESSDNFAITSINNNSIYGKMIIKHE